MIKTLSIVCICLLLSDQALGGGYRLQLYVQRLGGGPQVAVEVDSDATVGNLMEMIVLPRSSALSFGGRQLDGESLLSEAGICAEAMLQEVELPLQFDQATNQQIIFHSPQRITLSGMFDVEHGYATVAAREKVKFKIVQFDDSYTQGFIGIQKIHSADQSQQEAMECKKYGMYAGCHEREWKVGDVIEITIYCDEERVTHFSMSKNGNPPVVDEVRREFRYFKKDDWEFVIEINTWDMRMDSGYARHCSPIQIALLE